jgi:hypothetical protein
VRIEFLAARDASRAVVFVEGGREILAQETAGLSAPVEMTDFI